MTCSSPPSSATIYPLVSKVRKHIILAHVCALTVSSRALLTSELEEIFREAPLAPNALANERVRNAYALATGKSSTSQGSACTRERRIPTEDEDCPICYENMFEEASDKLIWCDECRKALHKECFEQCMSLKSYNIHSFSPSVTGAKSKRGNVTCVFCRAPWAAPGPSTNPGASIQRSREGYINLSAVAGLSPIRDTSTCRNIRTSLLSATLLIDMIDYQGPRRGKPYLGYQNYDYY